MMAVVLEESKSAGTRKARCLQERIQEHQFRRITYAGTRFHNFAFTMDIISHLFSVEHVLPLFRCGCCFTYVTGSAVRVSGTDLQRRRSASFFCQARSSDRATQPPFHSTPSVHILWPPRLRRSGPPCPAINRLARYSLQPTPILPPPYLQTTSFHIPSPVPFQQQTQPPMQTKRFISLNSGPQLRRSRDKSISSSPRRWRKISCSL
jgi:hypothetical protein